MVFDPKVYRNNKDGIGGPGDAAATTTTEESTLVSLMKGIFGKLGGGTSAVIASDVPQNSITAGQAGGLTQAAVTTAAPSYTTGKTNPLSLKTNGDLRVADTDGNTILTAMAADISTLKFQTDTLEIALGIVTETAPATDTASSGLNGRLQRVAQRLTSLIALVPASLGAKAAASSFAVTSSTEDVAQIGALTETAPATDTASSGLNGRLQRIAQRITSLIALVPASLGAKTAANSFAITTATDDNTLALYGAVTETAPATDTASSGLNGRLQRIAQRITSLIALVPASLGAKAAASSFAVTQSTEDAAQLGSLTETAPASDTASSGLNGRLQRVAQRITSLISLGTGPTTGTQSSVSGSATDVTILASNASRKGATVFNDSTSILYLLLANATSSSTVHTVQLLAGDYFELPVCQGGVYTGVIKGIWASATGAARVTEWT